MGGNTSVAVTHSVASQPAKREQMATLRAHHIILTLLNAYGCRGRRGEGHYGLVEDRSRVPAAKNDLLYVPSIQRIHNLRCNSIKPGCERGAAFVASMQLAVARREACTGDGRDETQQVSPACCWNTKKHHQTRSAHGSVGVRIRYWIASFSVDHARMCLTQYFAGACTSHLRGLILFPRSHMLHRLSCEIRRVRICRRAVVPPGAQTRPLHTPHVLLSFS